MRAIGRRRLGGLRSRGARLATFHVEALHHASDVRRPLRLGKDLADGLLGAAHLACTSAARWCGSERVVRTYCAVYLRGWRAAWARGGADCRAACGRATDGLGEAGAQLNLFDDFFCWIAWNILHV